MSKKMKIFISYNFKDEHKVHLLKAQLASSMDIDVAFVSDPHMNSERIEKTIGKHIDRSSLMLVMLSENIGKGQLFELNTALSKGIPIVGVLSNENYKIHSSITFAEKIPVVNWNWNEISKILAGQSHTLDYEAPKNADLESPILKIDFTKISEDLTQYRGK